MKILIVEDNMIAALALEMLLSQNKYKVVDKIINANSVYQTVIEHQPDILLMDIMLDENSSGIDAAKSLREKGIDTPVIFISALSDTETNNNINSIEHTYKLTKPYNDDELIKLLQLIAKK